MKIVVAIDSFKGSLSSLQAGAAASEGIKKVYPDAEIHISPLADGGEGTTDAIIQSLGGEIKTVAVHGPLEANVNARYGIVRNTKTAVLEMAAASGITLISEKERDPLNTTTLGVGEMIADAIKEGCRNFLIGIGGSATNDGGIGMLEALGVRFTDKDGNAVAHSAKGLETLSYINTENMIPKLAQCHFSIACDVKNPLCGKNGCSAVYGPQKGATIKTIEKMDSWLKNYATLTKKILPHANDELPGCGAAGGLGFAFTAYLNAELRSGIELVMEMTALEENIKNADLVITGEGKLDGQSCMGKAPIGIAKLAKKYQKPVIAIAGGVTDDAFFTHQHGIDAFFPIVRTPISLAEAMQTDTAARNLCATIEEIFRLIKTFAHF